MQNSITKTDPDDPLIKGKLKSEYAKAGLITISLGNFEKEKSSSIQSNSSTNISNLQNCQKLSLDLSSEKSKSNVNQNVNLSVNKTFGGLDSFGLFNKDTDHDSNLLYLIYNKTD